MIRIARSPSRLAHRGEHPSVLLVRPREQLGRVGDVGDQVAHLALRLGHRRPRAAGCRPPRRARCASGRRPGGRRGSPRASRPSRARSRAAARAPPARRARRRAPRRRARPRAAGRRRRASPPAARPTAPRPAAGTRPRTCRRCGRAPRAGARSATSAVSAWRSVEREIPSWRHSSRSAGSRSPGCSSPSLIAVPSRSSVSSNAVWDWTGAKTVCDEVPGSASFTAARIRGRAPSRSRRPRRRRARPARC